MVDKTQDLNPARQSCNGGVEELRRGAYHPMDSIDSPQPPTLDPLTQDIWFLPLMGTIWHLWKAGSPRSVCGLEWEIASSSWNATRETPPADLCEQCRA